MRTKQINSEFIKDLCDGVPSNEYVGMALGVSRGAAAHLRSKLSKTRAGRYKKCLANKKSFLPIIIEACIIHNCIANFKEVDTMEKVYLLAKSKGISLPIPESLNNSNTSNIQTIQNKFPQLVQTGPDWTPEEIALLSNLVGLKGDEFKREKTRIAKLRGCTTVAVYQKFTRLLKQGKLAKKVQETPTAIVVGKTIASRTSWSVEDEDKIRSLRPLEIKERKAKFKELAIELGRSYFAVDKKYSNLNIADRKEMKDSNLSTLAEIRNRVAQASSVGTKPESFKIILNGKEVSLQTNMEYKIENDKIFSVKKETKVVETLTELK